MIAADAGLLACRQAGIVPSLLLGDLDSLTDPAGDGIPLLRLPVEKDDTDTLAAIRLGLDRGCREFYLYGGGGTAGH